MYVHVQHAQHANMQHRLHCICDMYIHTLFLPGFATALIAGADVTSTVSSITIP